MIKPHPSMRRLRGVLSKKAMKFSDCPGFVRPPWSHRSRQRLMDNHQPGHSPPIAHRGGGLGADGSRQVLIEQHARPALDPDRLAPRPRYMGRSPAGDDDIAIAQQAHRPVAARERRRVVRSMEEAALVGDAGMATRCHGGRAASTSFRRHPVEGISGADANTAAARSDFPRCGGHRVRGAVGWAAQALFAVDSLLPGGVRFLPDEFAIRQGGILVKDRFLGQMVANPKAQIRMAFESR